MTAAPTDAEREGNLLDENSPSEQSAFQTRITPQNAEREAEARIVAWLRRKQNEWQAIADESERLGPFDHNYAADTASVWRDAADAIERGEHREDGDHG